MKRLTMRWLCSACLIASVATAMAQFHDVRPEAPQETARRSERNRLRDNARKLIKEGHIDQAIPVYEQACSIESQMTGFQAVVRCEFAKSLEEAGLTTKALDSYRQVFRWDTGKNDLVVGTGAPLLPTMDFAILLAKAGRNEEAKAMYYFGLRNLNIREDRSTEPVPFLVVFANEPQGVQWNYTPERLEAAALMVKLMTVNLSTRETSKTLQRIQELAPDWFYPTMWNAAMHWNSEDGSKLLSQAEALAQVGVERDLVATYRSELAEHKAMNVSNDTPSARDRRPMQEGNARRGQMQCLRPDSDILKKLVDRVQATATAGG